ncbi:hypothetical protein K439DRAFT_521159 [Ramaria rubella]|nr:hypothetical protein K439DRAFT_521159 [Ramaria rubella]
MDGVQPAGPSDRLDPDDFTDACAAVAIPHDDDEGLHLMYDCPRSPPDPISLKPSALQPPPLSPISVSQPVKIEITPDPPDYQVDISPISRQRTVRFRSRVRITSGVHSASSSTCGSVSSSISVPLRGAHESNAANAWLNRLSSARKTSRQRQERRSSSGSTHSLSTNERTPLTSTIHPGARRSYTEQQVDFAEEDTDAELDRMSTAARKSEEDVMFGKWPWRILNRHWWWWKILEPILCCCSRFDDESDEE